MRHQESGIAMNNQITAYNTPFGSIVGRFLSEHYGLSITEFAPRESGFILKVNRLRDAATNIRQFTIFRDVYDECIRTGKVPSRLIDNFKADLD